MTIDLEKFNKLKKKVEKAQSDADRAKGAIDTLLKQLEAEFKVSTLKEARELLTKLEKDEKDAERAYATSLKEFLDEHPEFDQAAS